MKDTNKFVNNKDFGKIAHSAAEQQGNENQRELYNLYRKDSFGQANTQDKSRLRHTKVTKDDVNKEMKKDKGLYNPSDALKSVRRDQRAGGKGK